MIASCCTSLLPIAVLFLLLLLPRRLDSNALCIVYSCSSCHGQLRWRNGAWWWRRTGAGHHVVCPLPWKPFFDVHMHINIIQHLKHTGNTQYAVGSRWNAFGSMPYSIGDRQYSICSTHYSISDKQFAKNLIHKRWCCVTFLTYCDCTCEKIKATNRFFLMLLIADSSIVFQAARFWQVACLKTRGSNRH